MPDVRLVIDGTLFGGWTEVRIQRSIEQLADTFELQVTERWPGQDERRPVRAGQACELRIDGELVLTGYVDDVAPVYDAQQHTLSVAGRSRLGDLVDCAPGGASFHDQTLPQIAKAVARPFGIGVVEATDSGGRFHGQRRLDVEQTGFEFLSGLARTRGVMLISNRNGDLMIARAGTERVSTALELGRNILRASGRHSVRDRFSEYVVLGQGFTDDENEPGDMHGLRGVAVDSVLKRQRYRPRTLRGNGPVTAQECRQRAEWERARAYGRSQGIVYTVNGWSHADGLWDPNTLVRVRDDYMQIDEERLIVSVQYILDSGGLRTELNVSPREAFDLLPLPESTDPLAN